MLPLIAVLMLASPAVPAEQAAPVQTEIEEDEQDEVICRRQFVEATRIGERVRSVRVCKTREEWRQRPVRR
ncbi:MAG: hypothetical protein KF780_04955 [Sphingomonas sp.]|nr:hypothetical protein [Sphingomonas sp.]